MHLPPLSGRMTRLLSGAFSIQLESMITRKKKGKSCCASGHVDLTMKLNQCYMSGFLSRIPDSLSHYTCAQT